MSQQFGTILTQGNASTNQTPAGNEAVALNLGPQDFLHIVDGSCEKTHMFSAPKIRGH